MTEVLLGSLIIVALVVGLAAGLLAARRRLIPDGGIDITVNEALHLVARRGAKLLAVLHNADIRIPAACGGVGTCGQWPARPACMATARCRCPKTR